MAHKKLKTLEKTFILEVSCSLYSNGVPCDFPKPTKKELDDVNVYIPDHEISQEGYAFEDYSYFSEENETYYLMIEDKYRP